MTPFANGRNYLKRHHTASILVHCWGRVMGNIKIEKTTIEDLFIIVPELFGDSRGYFMETFNQNDFHNAGLNYTFVQDNQSKSSKGVLRGLHYQKRHPQAKLVRVI